MDTFSDGEGQEACQDCPAGYFSLSMEGSSGCKKCDPGAFFRQDERTCQACQAGTYSFEDGVTDCRICPAGSFSQDVASTCVSCAVGKFSMENGSSGCVGCAPGAYAPVTGGSSCFGCDAGLFSSGIGAEYCVNCTNGTFSLDGASTCSFCLPGGFSTDSGVSACQMCSPGRYASGSGGMTCVGCEAGTFQGGYGGSTCLTCSAGAFSGILASACTSCPPGTYSQMAGASGCVYCGAGTFATKVGMTTMGECGPCEAGTFSMGLVGTTCEACAPGTYSWKGAVGCSTCPANSDSGGRATLQDCVCRAGFFYNWTSDSTDFACLGCPAGQFSAQAGASRCQDCPMGEYSLGGQVVACSLCRAGTYLDRTGASGCRNCSDGGFSGYDGATQCDLCDVGVYAGSGLSACLACETGTFGDRRGLGFCEDCPVGKYSTGVRVSGCTLCPVGTFQEKAGWTGCDLCLAGTFSDVLGVQNASECQDCPSGSYSTTEGLVDAGECLRCPVGRMSDPGATSCGDCRPGEFPNEVYGACATCPLHSAGVFENASRPEECRCTAGYRLAYNAKGIGGVEGYSGLVKTHTFQSVDSEFRLLTQAIVEAFCAGEQVLPPTVLQAGVYPGGSACKLPRVVQYGVDVQFDGRETQTYVQCIPCAAGTFSVGVVGERCQQCPSKRYQDLTGQTACKLCPSGRIENEGMAVCEPCPGTMVAQNEECRPCPAGTFFSRLRGDAACLRCPNNMWSEQGWDNCLLCPPSSSGPGGTGLDGCKCGVGLEMQVLKDSPYCVACKPGKYSNQGVCLPCWNGTYNTQAGSGVCYQCPSYAVAWGGATACTSCAMGKVPSRDGGSCVACPAGYYCGVGVLYACPPGSYSIKTGLTLKSQCPPCPRNYFCRSAVTIEACPAHTWSPLGSITRHYCVCDSGYKCLYSFSTVGNVNLALTAEEFAAQKDQILQALGKAAGVDPSLIKIVGVTQTTTSP